MDPIVLNRVDRTRMPVPAAILAEAFLDDPVACWPLPDGVDDLPDRLRSMFTWAYEPLCDLDMVRETADGAGVVVWIPPGGADALIASDRAVRQRLATLTFDDAARYGVLWEWLEDRLPDEPHWLLDAIGVDPRRQGEGIGGAMVAWGVTRADRDGVPAVLETGRERTVRFYERFGFRVIEQADAPDGGPTVWFMRREPAEA